MAVTNFHTMGNDIIGETTAGSSRVDYLTDALGSVTGTVNQSAQVVNMYVYTPSGATLAKTGSGPDPAFGWVGTKGYRPTGNPFSNFYIRGRHADSSTGRWPTQDPIGLRGGSLNFFQYAGNNPTSRTDPSGLADPWSCGICAAILGGSALGALLACSGDPRGFWTCVDCFAINNPWFVEILKLGASVSCGICLPQLVPIIGRISQPVLIGAGVLAGSPAFAMGGGSSFRDPCNPAAQPTCPTSAGPQTGPEVVVRQEPVPDPSEPGPQPRKPRRLPPPDLREITEGDCDDRKDQCILDCAQVVLHLNLVRLPPKLIARFKRCCETWCSEQFTLCNNDERTKPASSFDCLHIGGSSGGIGWPRF